ncbi:hypothetical protein TUM3794_20130 [Shewanella colwelliana]|uniref:Uncharacterized protein n=1 Tax=Shewanella colwelliana TaxID=23 RepID=A0ABQ4P0E1_SHECO|nr:hypothetical protein TUM3794_20130 [Shewanella colwelliana]
MKQILDCHIQNEPGVNSHNVVCTHPHFTGKLYTRLRSKDLKRLAKTDGVHGVFAEIELNRRGYIDSRIEGTKYSIEISLHAIDRLSMYHMHKFVNQYDGETGISSWCNQLVKEAFSQYKPEQIQKLCALESFKIQYQGVVFLFKPHEYRENVLVLTTVEP